MQLSSIDRSLCPRRMSARNAISGNEVYLASVKAVFSASLSDGRFVMIQKIGHLPDGGQHGNRTVAVGPDGKLYVSIGSSCNACAETNSEHATILRMDRNGMPTSNMLPAAHPVLAHNPNAMVSARVFVSGVRNTIGFDWHPATGELWGSDHGSDGLGDGWPFCWADRQVGPVVDEPSKMTAKEAYCPRTQPFVLGYQAQCAHRVHVLSRVPIPGRIQG